MKDGNSQKVIDYSIKGINFVTGLLMVLLTLIVFIEVLSRYFLKLPLTYTGELTSLIFPWMIFIGAISVTKEDGHLAINYFRSLMPRTGQKIALIITKLIMIYFSVFMVMSSYQLSQVVTNQLMPMLRISKSWLYISGTVAFIGVTIILIYQLILIVLNKMEAPKEEDLYDLDHDR
ncbi:TRAP transporter small permease [Anaerobacillus sp. MEB173]|uniref:TRAP transporter small permease n=1 Tax=Anaerobacillus sp. MEB173 TaxID=3383345 RepID=UPI003F8EAA2E